MEYRSFNGNRLFNLWGDVLNSIWYLMQGCILLATWIWCITVMWKCHIFTNQTALNLKILCFLFFWKHVLLSCFNPNIFCTFHIVSCKIHVARAILCQTHFKAHTSFTRTSAFFFKKELHCKYSVFCIACRRFKNK